MLFSTPFILSQSPLHFELYGVVKSCFIDTNLHTSFISSEINCVPLLLSISLGNPTRQKTFSSASTTLSVSILDSTITSGYLVAYSKFGRYIYSSKVDTKPVRIVLLDNHNRGVVRRIRWFNDSHFEHFLYLAYGFIRIESAVVSYIRYCPKSVVPGLSVNISWYSSSNSFTCLLCSTVRSSLILTSLYIYLVRYRCNWPNQVDCHPVESFFH